MQSIASASYAGSPPGVDRKPLDGPVATWQDNGAKVAVTTDASSTCPPAPTSVRASSSKRIVIEVAQTGGPFCTADLKTWTFVVDTPDGVDSGDEVTVQVRQDGNDWTPMMPSSTPSRASD